MAINQRKKGGKGEKMASDFLKEWSGLDFKRSPASGGLRGHIAEYTVGDLICTHDSYKTKIFPFTIEVKNYKEIDFSKLLKRTQVRSEKPVISEVDEWWNQSLEDSKRGQKIPLLMMRYNGLPKNFFFVVMDRKQSKHFKLPYDRMVTRDYTIFTTQALSSVSSTTFLKQAEKLWKSLYG